MAETPQIGSQAPDFTLATGDGDTVSLSDLRGATTILYFYPKDDTSGCTAEACGFRDLNSEIRAEGAQIFGVSGDDEASHRSFSAKNNLNFPLLADVDKSVSQQYGVWRERERDGQKFWSISRVTFAIDEDGKVANVWEVSDAANHSQEVLDWLKGRKA